MSSKIEVERIQDQLRRSHQGPAWHGPSLEQILQGVSASQAASHPLPEAHSIWELVLHAAGWEIAALRGLEGHKADLSEQENWPQAGDRSQAAWQQALEALQSSHRRLQEAVGRLNDDDLARVVQGSEGEYSIYGLLHGVIQHNLYHAGQMAILKKASRQG